MFRPLSLFLCLSSPALADAPRVVTDITPVHGLVSQVMAGVGAPDLLLAPGQSPHSYSMRPSDARKLQKADVVLWVGAELTPWLEKPLSSLAEDARRVSLLDAPGLDLMQYEEDADEHEDHEDHHEEGHKDAHGEDKHDDHHDAGHAHEDEDHHDEDHHAHDDAHDDHHEDEDEHHHHHDGIDPHAWLDPTIAVKWLGEIARVLAEVDPENADLYRANAERAQQTLTDLDQQIAERLGPVQGVAFVTFHDAYRYFERRYGLQNAGTVSDGDARDPGAARIASIQAEIAARGVKCSFAEPQFDPALLAIAGEENGVKIATLDPLGMDLEAGVQFYPELLQTLTESLLGCLAE